MRDAPAVKRLKVQPTCDTSAYVAGDLIGALQTVPLGLWRDAGGVMVVDMHLVDLANQKKAIDVVFFSEQPDTTGWADNAPFDPADADKGKIVKRWRIDSYESHADNADGLASQFRPFVLEVPAAAASPAFWLAFVAREGVTFAAAGDLSLNIGLASL